MPVLELGSNQLPMTYPAPERPIWRYMSLAKFVSLLATSCLWFARADHLGDPYEGSRSAATSGLPPEVQSRLGGMALVAQALLPLHFVSCWSMSDVESAALWEIYSGRGSGVAIRSTAGRLSAALEPNEEWVTVAAVNYQDFRAGYVPVGWVTERLFYKRSSFAHEQELRAVLTPIEWLAKNSTSAALERSDLERRLPLGWPLVVDLHDLVDAVYVSPLSPDWFLDAARSLVERYELEVTVERSDLDTDPVF